MQGIQKLLKDPNEKSPAQHDAFTLYTNDRNAYNEKVKAYAKEHPIP